MAFRIGSRLVGRGEPVFVVAEIGLNHGGSLPKALAMVDAAARAGASAIKLQTLKGDRLVSADAPPPAHVNVGSLRAFFARFELDETAHRELGRRAHESGMAFLSTPFDEESVGMLVRAGCDALKIASGDLTHFHLIERAASTGLPLILSTGMAERDEVVEALAHARRAGARDVALLHCVSAYPVPHGSENLGAIADLEEACNVPVGLSDHGTDPMATVAAVALGACIIEKHLVLAACDGSVDEAVSLTPEGLAALVVTANQARAMVGEGGKRCLPAEEPNRVGSRRGLYAARPLSAGEIVADSDVIALRPALGLDARRWSSLIGARLTRTVAPGEPFLPSDLGGVQ